MEIKPEHFSMSDIQLSHKGCWIYDEDYHGYIDDLDMSDVHSDKLIVRYLADDKTTKMKPVEYKSTWDFRLYCQDHLFSYRGQRGA